MNTPILAVTSSSFLKNDILMEELKTLPVKLVGLQHPGKYKEENLISLINDFKIEVLILALEPLSRKVIDRCPSLRFISKYGVGLDNIDLDALAEYKIGLGWTGGVNSRSVSELTLAFALSHCRNVFTSNHKMKRGIWEKTGGRQLSDLKFGIVGLGHVGSDVARLLTGFGTKVFYSEILDKTTRAKGLGIEKLSYPELVESCDVLSFHVPSTPLTKGMFSSPQILRSKPGQFVINTSRGDITDFGVVCQAVYDGKLGGFACDVFTEEPLDGRFWAENPNIIFTPHIGGSAAESILAMGRSAIGHVAEYTGTRKIFNRAGK